MQPLPATATPPRRPSPFDELPATMRPLAVDAEPGPRLREVALDAGVALECAARVFAWSDGSRTLAELAGHFEGGTAARVVGWLYERGLVADQSLGPLPAWLFYGHLRRRVRAWLARRGPSPLVRRLWAGGASRRLALGHLVETFHLVDAAPSHIASALASTASRRLQPVLGEYLASEQEHGAWVRRGLLAAGLAEAELARATPLPGTLAQINHLRWLAASDRLAYAACLGAGESAPGSAPLAGEFWRRVGAGSALPPEAIGPFSEHDIADDASEHAELGAEFFAEMVSLSGEERGRIGGRVLSYCEAMYAAHRDALEAYGEGDGPPYHVVDDNGPPP